MASNRKAAGSGSEQGVIERFRGSYVLPSFWGVLSKGRPIAVAGPGELVFREHGIHCEAYRPRSFFEVMKKILLLGIVFLIAMATALMTVGTFLHLSAGVTWLIRLGLVVAGSWAFFLYLRDRGSSIYNEQEPVEFLLPWSNVECVALSHPRDISESVDSLVIRVVNRKTGHSFYYTPEQLSVGQVLRLLTLRPDVD